MDFEFSSIFTHSTHGLWIDISMTISIIITYALPEFRQALEFVKPKSMLLRTPKTTGDLF